MIATLTHALELAVIAAAAAVILLAGLRVALTRRALRNRVGWVALPADEFDPALEDVSRFAFQLTRTRRAILGWFERPASAVRISLRSAGEGQMLYALEGPGHARSMLRSATYDRVQLHDPEDLDLTALALTADVGDASADAGGELERPAGERAEPTTPGVDDPREDLDNDWAKEDRW